MDCHFLTFVRMNGNATKYRIMTEIICSVNERRVTNECPPVYTSGLAQEIKIIGFETFLTKNFDIYLIILSQSINSVKSSLMTTISIILYLFFCQLI